MPIKYSPDTCNCIVIYDDDCESFVDWEQKCQLHKNIDGQKLLEGVFTYNKSIGKLKETGDITDEEIQDSVKEKQKALAANTALGPPITNPEF